jgi:hypothetical protein
MLGENSVWVLSFYLIHVEHAVESKQASKLNENNDERVSAALG